MQEAFLGLDVWTRQLVWRAFKGAHPCVQRGDAIQLWQDHPWRPLRRAFGVCSAGGGPSGGQPCGHFGPPCEQGRRHVKVACALEGQAFSAVGRGAANKLPSRSLNRALGHFPCQSVSGLAKGASAFAFALKRHGQSCEAWSQLNICLGRVP